MTEQKIYNHTAWEEGVLAVGKIAPQPFTIEIRECDSITLMPKGVDVKVKFERDDIDKVDTIIINGNEFRRVENDR